MLTRACYAVLLLALAIGCGQPSPTTRPAPAPSTPKPPQTAEQLNGRLEAALKMTNHAQQHEALKAVAEDAASASAAEIVTKALDAMDNHALRNEVAADCALRIAKRGDPKSAATVAERISNRAQRDDVLSKIAKGG